MKFEDYKPPSFDVWCMKQVYLTAERSKDPSTKIGAVLVREKNIIGSGYNGFARKVFDLPERYKDRNIKYKFVVHAESNAVLTCARLGIPVLDSVLYTNAIPCHECAKSIIQGGIKEIVVHSKWPMSHSKWASSMEISQIMFKESDVKIRYLDDILGLTGFINGQKISV